MPESHRTIQNTHIRGIQNMAAPFSCFDYVEREHGNAPAIHRGFSIARAAGAQTVVVEDIPPAGMITEENEDWDKLDPNHQMPGLRRVSFWRNDFKTLRGLESKRDDDLLGYMILKQDQWGRPTKSRWRVFEAVFLKYEHPHNCVPGLRTYTVRVGPNLFRIQGVLFAQQNGETNACAHVALRTLLSRHLAAADISYRDINRIAAPLAGRIPYFPRNGLNAAQIRAVLDEYDIGYRDIEYDNDDALRKALPYGKYVYAGIESGAGALLGFQLKEKGTLTGDFHIIPFFGHTFNKDAWVPDAEMAYFSIGESIGYIPSISWTSSFIGHDDNFGANFCVNRHYIEAGNVQYAVELLPSGFKSSGLEAEAYAAGYLYALVPFLDGKVNAWVKRLLRAANGTPPKVILRAVAVDKLRYLEYLKNLADWEGRREYPDVLAVFTKLLPEHLWAVEISLPQLFPANEHKLGEIVLRGDVNLSSEPTKGFFFARLPGAYFFADKTSSQSPRFVSFDSDILSHTPVIPSR